MYVAGTNYQLLAPDFYIRKAESYLRRLNCCIVEKNLYCWLILYQAVGPHHHFRLGAMLLDLENPSRVLHRTPDWLIQSEEDYKIKGYYPGVIFPCGIVVIDGQLFVYYGGAGKFVGLAICSLQEILDHLLSCPI